MASEMKNIKRTAANIGDAMIEQYIAVAKDTKATIALMAVAILMMVFILFFINF